jgi:hypothetical protein
VDENTVFVCDQDNNLWLEYGPFGGQVPLPQCPSGSSASSGQNKSCRVPVDGNVDEFQIIDVNTAVVLGMDNNLWLERGPFGTVPLPPCPGPQYGNCRIQIDGNVAAFLVIDQNTILVNGQDNNLWLEYADFGTIPLPPCLVAGQGSCRTQVDANVAGFDLVPPETGQLTTRRLHPTNGRMKTKRPRPRV